MNKKSEGRLVGYARVSTHKQELVLQLDALQKAGVAKKLIFIDKVSGAKSIRPGLDECLERLHEGDTLLVWRLDPLGPAVGHLIDLVGNLPQRHVQFQSDFDRALFANH